MTHPGAPVGQLVVCPTPIGNLDDVTLRVLSTLARADVVACEDTRRTGRLLERHGIRRPLVSYHEHNEAARTPELLARIAEGRLVALLSDAGTPLVADPGHVLVQACIREGLHFEVLPGPSAVVTALVVSGLASARWRFVGFLPRRRAEREQLLAGCGETVVAFESPQRLPSTLELIARGEPGRTLAVCRELSKLHEEVLRGSAAELAEHFAGAAPRGEIVLVCAPAERAAGADAEAALAALQELIDAGARPRAAAGALARVTGLGANELYRALTRK
ncbi:MAG TPA: 16S rRNA (cytidine(1402)-2'-O)-methyltransferase [Solirubrobacteraceae bacterium]|nr:16S rRNA (cytidine(1402)-2'-O)-methyltransferase [Solirubrobacteraceae bacterium]